MAKTIEKTKETKPKTVKNTKKKIEKEVEVVEEVKVEEVVKTEKRSRQQIRKAIKKDAPNITVYVMNLSSNQVKFTYANDVIFDLKDEGSETDISLDEFALLKNGHKGFFEKHLIAVTDIDCDGEDEYEIEDILDYLGVSDVYDEIENYDMDYIKYILTKADAYDLEKLLANCDDYLAERIAERAVKMLKKGKLDSIKKQDLIARRVGLKELYY